MSNTKSIMAAVGAVVALWIVFYGAFAYTRADLNPAAWPLDIRGIHAVISVVAGGALFGFIFVLSRGYMR
jgi:uncharacterized membrane-anchored protein